MNNSPIGRLSGELRNRIYHFFFSSQLAAQTHIDVRENHPRLKRNQDKTRSALALTAVCHQLRRETLAILWSTASFRIVANTLTAYSYPDDNDGVLGVDPMNRAKHINDDRAEILKAWLQHSGIKNFTRLLRPIELDLGMYDPRVQRPQHQHYVLRSLGEDTLELTKVLEDNTSNAATCTLHFKVQLQPSTALGPIIVPNSRQKALKAISKLCDRRQTAVKARYREGMLTRHGYSILSNDVASCRAVADLLVWYIVKEKEKSDENGGGGGTKSKNGSPGEKSKRSGQ